MSALENHNSSGATMKNSGDEEQELLSQLEFYVHRGGKFESLVLV